ncbi:MAG: DUF6155 family protein [Bacteroidota bacterium]
MNLTNYKKYLATLDREGLEQELIQLYKSVPEIKAYSAAKNMKPEQIRKELEKYKKKIEAEFWTRGGNPRSPNNRNILQYIQAFEKMSKNPKDVIDLLVHRVEIATDFASQFGGMPDKDYDASYNAFDKAVKLMAEHNLVEHFRARCEDLIEADNIDYWYIEYLEEAFKEYLG